MGYKVLLRGSINLEKSLTLFSYLLRSSHLWTKADYNVSMWEFQFFEIIYFQFQLQNFVILLREIPASTDCYLHDSIRVSFSVSI